MWYYKLKSIQTKIFLYFYIKWWPAKRTATTGMGRKSTKWLSPASQRLRQWGHGRKSGNLRRDWDQDRPGDKTRDGGHLPGGMILPKPLLWGSCRCCCFCSHGGCCLPAITDLWHRNVSGRVATQDEKLAWAGILQRNPEVKKNKKLPVKREEPAATAIAAGDYEKNLSECRYEWILSDSRFLSVPLMILVYAEFVKQVYHKCRISVNNCK